MYSIQNTSFLATFEREGEREGGREGGKEGGRKGGRERRKEEQNRERKGKRDEDKENIDIYICVKKYIALRTRMCPLT